MKEKLTRNIGLKILSIILASIFWLIITNVDDPISDKEFKDVKVQILHEDAVKNTKQGYEILEGATIDFTFTARRSIRDELTPSDFLVTADFSKLSDVNAVTIDIKCLLYGEDDVRITEGLYQVMKINPEEIADKNVKVDVVQTGTPAEGFYAESSANALINVRGPKSKIDRIALLKAEVNVDGYSQTVQLYKEVEAYDAEGNQIDDSNLEFSSSTVLVNIKLYRTKTIDLVVETLGNPAYGYMKTTMDYEPKTIVVAGENKALNNVNTLTISKSIEGAKDSTVEPIKLQEYLDDLDLILVGESKTVTVDIGIVPTLTKEFQISPSDIDIRNNTDNLKVLYFNPTGPITIQITGPAEEVEELTAAKLDPYIDLSLYSAGYNNLSIIVENIGLCKVKNNPTVVADLQK